MSSIDGILGVVIDAGSQNLKAGFAGEDSPRCVFPTTVGRFRSSGLSDGIPELYCGKEALMKRGLSTLTWPVRAGLICDWDEMEKLWYHAFYSQLLVPPEEARILHAVDPLVPRGDRERMAEILFESFAIQGLNLMKSPVLVLHASGRTSGVVYENGFSSSYVTPILEGFPLSEAIVRSSVTGEALSNRLQKQLASIGYSFTTPVEKDLIDRIKIQTCYVAQDFDAEIKKSTCSSLNDIQYTLPDGQHIRIGKERFLCPEILFQPSLDGVQSSGIVDLICSSVSKCDIEYKSLFYGKVVVSGGSSMFPGLISRLSAELTLKVKNKDRIKVEIDELPSRHLAAWTGGSIMASLDCLKGFWMTKQEYEDLGPDRVNYKFN